MNRVQAFKILGLDSDAEAIDIKKKYRKLMHQVHPDSNSVNEYSYTAQEINEAYSYLCKSGINESAPRNATKRSAKKKKPKPSWNADINQYAYMDRNVYQYVEDNDGQIMGDYIIACGRYIWTLEEDFPLFLKSIFECSKKILDEIGEYEKRVKYQPELTYLLAQQFIDISGTLKKLVEVTSNEDFDLFYISSMLEATENTATIRAGMTLYPYAILQHKLYLMTSTGKKVGYLSFRDDRMYYLIIPLFEQKRAQVKIEIAKVQDRKNTRAERKYKNLDMWVRILHKDEGLFPENINIQIDNLIEKIKRG